jgi:hypothetical protein
VVPLVYLKLHTERKDMRHLLSGVAIIAALAIPTLASAQRMGPGSYAYTGTGPGVTPPGGFGPSSTLFNVPEGSPSLPPSAVPSGMAARPAATTPLPPGAMPPAVYPQSR